MRRNGTIKIAATALALALAGFGLWALSGQRGGKEGDIGIDLDSLKFGQDGGSAAAGERYQHLDPEFSFAYEDGWTATNFSEGEGETVLVRRKDGTGAQVYMQPFDEEIDVTPERIRRDIPDMSVRAPQDVVVAGSPAIMFESGNTGIETVEVWFISKGYLYQVSAPIAQGDMVRSIIATWEW